MTGNNGKGIIIQERDRELLREIAVMRVIDREQAKRAAGFGSTTRANTRLLGLVRSGLLRRFFLGSDGVGQKALYALSEKGARLVGVPCRGPRRRQDETLVADLSVVHQLRVNDLYCRVKFGGIPNPGARFVRWMAFHERIEANLSLIPDGYLEIAASAKPLTAFLEVDLGHERGNVWPTKVMSYLRYAVSGAFAKQFGHPQFRTLVVGPSDKRVQSLRKATAKVTEKIFWFTTFDAIDRDGFWSPIWQRPTGDAKLPLLELP
ncbi:MAG TPA: replication-relaxation family protein [Bryobacteraceae bacterium]|jgi:hypothetical protein|nr:replication-relaxation family protein [Bryobacteraceae bacterium]